MSGRRMLAYMLDDFHEDAAADVSAAMYASIAEPGDYDPASASSLPITDAESLALACRRMRRHAKASQRAFAAKAGVSKTTIGRIETGDIDPSIGLVMRLAKAADLTLTLSGLEPTSFIFGIVETKRDGAGRHAPPHRLSKTGAGWWDTSSKHAVERALVTHQADISMLISVAAARAAELHPEPVRDTPVDGVDDARQGPP